MDDKVFEVICVLYVMGFFNDVCIVMQGNVVIVQVQECLVIVLIDFIGMKEFDKDNLMKVLCVVGFVDGCYYDKVFVDKVEQEFKCQYLMCGFYVVEVKMMVMLVDVNCVLILFVVVEGLSVKICQINFIGNKVFSISMLCDEMQLLMLNWFFWYMKNDLYLKEKFMGDFEVVCLYYLNCGYFEFNIELIQVLILLDKKDMYLMVMLYEGELYMVLGIKLLGNLFDCEVEFNKLIKIKLGDCFLVEKLQQIIKLIVDKFGEYGYVFVIVNVQLDIDQVNYKVNLNFVVDLSCCVYVCCINVVGNMCMCDEVVCCEMCQFESLWFDLNCFVLLKDCVNCFGYFINVDVMMVLVDGMNDQVDVNVKVDEKLIGVIMLGVGFLLMDKVVLLVGVLQDNVFGLGMSLLVNVNIVKSYCMLIVMQVDLYFMVDGIKWIMDVYYCMYQLFYYLMSLSFWIISVGGNLKFGILFLEVDIVYFGVGFEQNCFDVDLNMLQSYQDYVNEFGCVLNMVLLMVVWLCDVCDSVLILSCGYFMQVNIEYGVLVGKIQYYKVDLQVQYYYLFLCGFILGLNL